MYEEGEETRVLDPTGAAELGRELAVEIAHNTVKVLSPRVEKFSDWLMPDEKTELGEEDTLVRCRQCSRFVPIQVSVSLTSSIQKYLHVTCDVCCA